MEYEKQTVKISKLKSNTGQIPEVPKNPRFIRDERYNKLVDSIKSDPEMLGLRELIAYRLKDDLIVIAGNMRLRACKELGIKEVPVKILPESTPAKKLRAIAIKDNVGFGENDNDLLANEWDIEELEEFGLVLPSMDDFSGDPSGSLDGVEVEESSVVITGDANEIEMLLDEIQPVLDRYDVKTIIR